MIQSTMQPSFYELRYPPFT